MALYSFGSLFQYDATSHIDGVKYFIETTWNGLFKLVGLEHRITLFPSSAKLLIETENQPQYPDLTARAWQEAASKISELHQRIPPFMKFTQEKREFHEGVCQGMVSLFIREYYKNRAYGFAFEEAAIQAAELFKQGAPPLACEIQQLHNQSNGVIKKEFKRCFPKNPSYPYRHYVYRYQANTIFTHLMLGAKKVKIATSDCSDEQSIKQFSDGVYDVSTGTAVSPNKKNVTEAYVGHATALLVHENSRLIFDPNVGLFSHPDPDHYYRVIKKRDDGILMLISIKY